MSSRTPLAMAAIFSASGGRPSRPRRAHRQARPSSWSLQDQEPSDRSHKFVLPVLPVIQFGEGEVSLEVVGVSLQESLPVIRGKPDVALDSEGLAQDTEGVEKVGVARQGQPGFADGVVILSRLEQREAEAVTKTGVTGPPGHRLREQVSRLRHVTHPEQAQAGVAVCRPVIREGLNGGLVIRPCPVAVTRYVEMIHAEAHQRDRLVLQVCLPVQGVGLDVQFVGLVAVSQVPVRGAQVDEGSAQGRRFLDVVRPELEGVGEEGVPGVDGVPLGQEKKGEEGGGGELDHLFVGEVVDDPQHGHGHGDEEEQGGDVVPVLVDEVEGKKGAFHGVVEKVKEDGKGDERAFPGEIHGEGDEPQDQGHGRERGPGRDEGGRQLGVVDECQPGIAGIKEDGHVKDDDPRLRQEPLGEGEGPV